MTLKNHISLQDKIIQNLTKVLTQCNKSMEYRMQVFFNIDKKIDRLKKSLDEHKFKEIQTKLRNSGFFTKRAQALQLIEKLQSDLNKLKLNIKTLEFTKKMSLGIKKSETFQKEQNLNTSLLGKFLGKIKVAGKGFL